MSSRYTCPSEILGMHPPSGDVVVEANFVLLEGRPDGTTTWGGRVRYQLRATDDDWRLALKVVDLVNRPWDVPTLAFLI